MSLPTRITVRPAHPQASPQTSPQALTQRLCARRSAGRRVRGLGGLRSLRWLLGLPCAGLDHGLATAQLRRRAAPPAPSPLARVMRRALLLQVGVNTTNWLHLVMQVRQLLHTPAPLAAGRRMASPAVPKLAGSRDARRSTAQAQRQTFITHLAARRLTIGTTRQLPVAPPSAMRHARVLAAPTLNPGVPGPATPTAYQRMALVVVRSGESVERAARPAGPGDASPILAAQRPRAATADRPDWPAASPPLPAHELHRVTEHVLNQLDRRALSWRERGLG